MTVTAWRAGKQSSTEGYRHEALFYAGEDEFVARIGTFLLEGARSGEPTLVVVSARKIDRLRRKLGRDAKSIEFADMADVGANPGRIIPAWDQFVATHKGEGRRLRGVGEPIFPERSSDELVECEGHEALLNASFPQNLPFWLVCPYDKTALPPAVLVEAERNHPLLREGKREKPSEIYRGERVQTDPFTAPLPDAPVDALVVAYDATTLGKARALVSRRAAVAGFRPSALADLVFAVNEVATNSIRHGGGAGTLRLWLDDDRLLCELRDSGHFQHQPLVGRERPTADPSGPRGLWLANQLCDLVQVRSFPTGAVVRLHMRRR